MVKPSDIVALANQHVGRVLDVAEAAIPADRFPAFRRIMLREFGHDGFAGEVETMLRASPAGAERNGSGRNEAGRKGGAP